MSVMLARKFGRHYAQGILVQPLGSYRQDQMKDRYRDNIVFEFGYGQVACQYQIDQKDNAVAGERDDRQLTDFREMFASGDDQHRGCEMSAVLGVRVNGGLRVSRAKFSSAHRERVGHCRSRWSGISKSQIRLTAAFGT
ncbi:hypothetical protein GNX18_07840 [Microbulbifer sp. SH-1]|uniref:hypothetical protein n=1 Tax=Microbulbifer sp. SH-1 TaxID=2681547 RepID=UPI00140A49EE|nr:hypothetical protein [Microbulbifer sp. SH-1]QIL89674.1 hypothetical protein GNX18_07840 [Microbulbifer sp. SH-1]